MIDLSSPPLVGNDSGSQDSRKGQRSCVRLPIAVAGGLLVALVGAVVATRWLRHDANEEAQDG